MALKVDLSKPLSSKAIARLKTRLPKETVEHYVRLAAANGGPDRSDKAEAQEAEVAAKQAEAEAEQGDLFDPAAHNVEQVQEYLLTADADEAERVLEAERAGKARKNILSEG